MHSLMWEGGREGGMEERGWMECNITVEFLRSSHSIAKYIDILTPQNGS